MVASCNIFIGKRPRQGKYLLLLENTVMIKFQAKKKRPTFQLSAFFVLIPKQYYLTANYGQFKEP